MSGGSWDYFYGRLEDVASRLQCERDPLRKAFGSHLQKCAKALHDIEWVDSSDCSPGDEVESIKAALADCFFAARENQAGRWHLEHHDEQRLCQNCGKPAVRLTEDGINLCRECYALCPEDTQNAGDVARPAAKKTQSP